MFKGIMVDLSVLGKYEQAWRGAQMDGSINLSFQELKELEKVHYKIFGIGFCKSCPEHSYTAFVKLMRQYDLWKIATNDI